MRDHPELRLENQLCFPLYACSKEIVRRYTPHLEPLGLTYTQYIVMMVLWEDGSIGVKELGHKLWLDSGTLTPVVKKLEAQGYVSRQRCTDDERHVSVTLTEAGKALEEKAASIPGKVSCSVSLTAKEAMQLHGLLYRILNGLDHPSLHQ